MATDYPSRSIAVILKRIDSSKKPAANKKAVHDLIAFLQAKDSDPKTIVKHLYSFEKFLDALDGIDVRKATKEDIERAMARINATKLAEWTKSSIKVVVKAWYKHFVGEDLYYPKQVAWIKAVVKKRSKLLPDDMLDEDEILKMLGGARDPRDKAIIALLFDSGVRSGEMLGMRVKDVDLDKELAHISVNGKTGLRRIPIMFSVPYLGQYLPLLKDSKPNDPLWPSIGSRINQNAPLNRAGLNMVLRRAAKRAKISKRIYPHLFRHSRASYYANKLTEQQLKAFFGWTGDSRMASTYVHLSGRDIDNAVMKVYGVGRSEEESRPKLTVIICQKCRESNTIDAQYCARCGSPLMPKLNVEHGEKEDLLRKAMVKALDSDPKLVEELIHQYLESKRKKR